ncbi:hydantoinase/oxoprolinase family protein [Roseovarius sp. MMSF_3281]|uniref:hydantoinase/oxoprolinase family protein n=1 Tax=Roseovarius sp. MMSF_3281 TaxID=3046694 RepID=UPI0027402DF8|nr:hydantoinase/oxoprolinase family protein [Roseovarius sp. MMSF_3281]
MQWRVASDIGGTFTDIAHIDESGVLSTIKVPSSPPNYGQGVVAGVSQLAQEKGFQMADLSAMAHGCTVATNAILEKKGARTALITTQGFRDVLELRRIRVPRLYEPLFVKPTPLVPRDLRFEVEERLDAKGAIVTPLNEDDLRRAAAEIKSSEAEAVAVCFLHSYTNPEHERRAGQLLKELLPDVFITLSVDTLPQIREYERTSTTVVNAYVGPPVRRYLNGMEHDLKDAGADARISVMQSSGGTVEAAAVREKPAQIVECGPAAGVVAAMRLANMLGIENAITFDMGGTTAKGSMIENGGVIFAEDYEVGDGMSTKGAIAGGGGYALRLPVIDISEVGAGGGSYVWLDKAGAIKVGPESAGASPGPACYDAGGTRPTVTDANVVLGYLNQTALAGGSVPISSEMSRRAICDTVATPTGLDPFRAAYGVHQVANATMVRAVKAVTTYRGRDPRDFALIAFGGNGGVHGVGLARSLEIGKVIVPPAAGVFSAVGLLLADRSVAVNGAFSAQVEALNRENADIEYDRLKKEAARLLGLDVAAARCALDVEMRYVGQAFELTIPLEAPSMAKADLAGLRGRFDKEHEQRFGHSFGLEEPVEIVSIKVTASDPDYRRPETIRLPGSERKAEALRDVWFGDEHGLCKTPIVSRSGLDETPRNGPLIVEDYEGTTIVPPDAKALRDKIGNIVIELEYAK